MSRATLARAEPGLPTGDGPPLFSRPQPLMTARMPRLPSFAAPTPSWPSFCPSALTQAYSCINQMRLLLGNTLKGKDAEWWVPKAGREGGMGNCYLMGTEVGFRKVKKYWR